MIKFKQTIFFKLHYNRYRIINFSDIERKKKPRLISHIEHNIYI